MYDIKNFRKSFLGALQFDLKAPGHRGYQTFIFYPIQNKTDVIFMQSDKRWAEYRPQSRTIDLSRSRANQNDPYKFMVDRIQGKIRTITLTPEDNQLLIEKIRALPKTTTNKLLELDNSGADKI